MKKDRTCICCGKEFKNIEGKIFSNHVRWCDKNPKEPRNEEYISKLSTKAKINEEKKYGKFRWSEVVCNSCGVCFCVREREKLYPKKERYYCSLFCSHIRPHTKPKWTDEQRKNQSEKSKLLWKNKEYFNKTTKNNKKFFTSKGEEEIKDFMKTVSPGDGWTFGGHLKFENFSLIRDLYSDKLKVCVEYDGDWHFKDIHGQLKDKRNKDKALESWCLKNGYRLIRIDEREYKKNKKYWKHILLDEIYNGTEKIVKFGYRY